MQQTKYLVPGDLSTEVFVTVMRNRLCLAESEVCVFYVNYEVLGGGRTLQDVYNDMKDSDGFLYLTYSSH